MKKESKAKEYAKQHSNYEEEYKLLLDAYISGWDAAEEILNINSIENKSQSEEILRIIREHTSTEFINKKVEDDFFMNVLANLVAKKIEKILGL